MMKYFKEMREVPHTLYHSTTSDCIKSLKKGIDLKRGKKKADFGIGFYLTANYFQARQWAKFKEKIAERSGIFDANGVIISYEVEIEKLVELECYFFDQVDAEWAKFIYGNRSLDFSHHHNQNQRYDFVYGPLADGGEISVKVRELKNGDITFQEFLNSITGYKHPFPRDHQMSFHTAASLKALQFREVEYYGKQLNFR